MAKMALTFGACPVCDRHVARTVQTNAGLQKEVFHCPDHGRLAYEPHAPMMSLRASIANLASHFAQPATGLEIVH